MAAGHSGDAQPENDDKLVFADEDTIEVPGPIAEANAWKIIVIDDEPEVHAVSRLALANLRVDGRPIEILSALDGSEAKQILRETPDVALVLLDVVMESERAGLELARWIRDELGNHQTRLILRTGQPGTAPEQRVMLEYDINDYRAKTELTAQRLVTTVIGGIRSYRDLRTIEGQKQGLERVVAATVSLFEIHSFQALLGGILSQIATLGCSRRSTMFVMASGPLFGFCQPVRAEGVEQPAPIIVAGTGRFTAAIGDPAPNHVEPGIWADVSLALERQPVIHRGGYSVFGLCHEERSFAALYVETAERLSSWENHLLELFCRNATAACDNLRLHQNQLALTGVFERFVPKRVLELIGASDVTQVEVGDHLEREMTVVVLDLYGFTRLAEQLRSDETFAFLNAFFAALVPVLHEHGGVVDTYTGDGLIALFPDSADAVRAALGMIEQTRRFADEYAGPLPQRPRVGIGVHRGPMILGLCGAADRLAFTAVADCVNAAARIERLTRDFEADVLISSAIHERLPSELQALSRPLGLMELRGKQQGIEIFEVFATDTPNVRTRKAATREGMTALAEQLRAGRWQDARERIAQLQIRWPDDSALAVIDRYCRRQIFRVGEERPIP